MYTRINFRSPSREREEGDRFLRKKSFSKIKGYHALLSISAYNHRILLSYKKYLYIPDVNIIGYRKGFIMRDVVVIGAGLHRYGMFPEKTTVDMGTEAISLALTDAGMAWKDIEAAYCGTVQPGVSGGHAICNKMGCTGLGITIVENASASGSSAFREAYLSVASGENDIVLAFGIDKLGSQLLAPPPVSSQPQPKPENAAPPEPKQSQPEPEKDERVDSKFKKMLPVQYFAGLAQHYMKEYGVTREQLGQVSVKSHFNASLNPYAHFQKPCTLEQANNARMVADPLTVLHCCPMDDGAAAVIVCAKEIAKKYTGQTVSDDCRVRSQEYAPGWGFLYHPDQAGLPDCL